MSWPLIPIAPATPEPAGFRDRPDSPVLFMREAGEVPLITPQQEIEVAARIQRGDDDAREHMIRANLRLLVIKIARQYENLGLPLLDLINEGNIGLMKAVERFNPSKGKLSTYVVLWIKQQIRRALASQGKTIRLPVHIADRIYQLTQAEVRLCGELGRDTSDEELADALGIKLTRLAKLRSAALRPSSLDAPLGAENSSTVADENAGSPFDHLLNRSETKLVCQLLEKLPPREARIIRFRFGLHGGTERTLEDVSLKFRLTRERIGQLQNLALKKLRQMLEEPQNLPLAA